MYLKRQGNFVTIIFTESIPKDRGYLEFIAPAGSIPEFYRPHGGVVLEIFQAPNSGPFRIKINTDGSIQNIYRYGSTSVIYNNQIENSAFVFIARNIY